MEPTYPEKSTGDLRSLPPWQRVWRALQQWRRRPDFRPSILAICLFGVLVWVTADFIRNNRPPDYGWMPFAGLAVAPAVWLGLRFKRVRDHAESIPVFLAVFVVLTGAMLDLE